MYACFLGMLQFRTNTPRLNIVRNSAFPFTSLGDSFLFYKCLVHARTGTRLRLVWPSAWMHQC